MPAIQRNLLQLLEESVNRLSFYVCICCFLFVYLFIDSFIYILRVDCSVLLTGPIAKHCVHVSTQHAVMMALFLCIQYVAHISTLNMYELNCIT